MTDPEDYMVAADLVDDAAEGFPRLSPAARRFADGAMGDGEARLLGFVADGR